MKKLITTLLLGVCGTSWAVPAVAEVRIGNGGDSLAAQFVETADEMIDLIERALATGHFKLPQEVNFPRLKQKVATAKVFSQDKTFLQNGIEVDALNFPAENKIVFNRERMRHLVFNLKAQRVLVMHEYLWLSGVDDSSYRFSVFLARKLANGGDRGEYWLLKDMAIPGFQNPFLDPILKFDAKLFNSPDQRGGKVTRFFQDGRSMDEDEVDAQRPHCVLDVNTVRPGGNTGTVREVQMKITAANKVGRSAGSEIALTMQRPTLVPYLECRSGNGNRRVTVGDMLDAFGTSVQLEHSGKFCVPCPTCPGQ